jgi:PmbA protein
MSSTKRQSVSKRAESVTLRSERELHQIGGAVLRLAKLRGVPEAEVHIDETIYALTRFANNTIHQHVAEQGLVVSIRTVLDGRTARVTTNKVDEDALRAAIDDCLSLASHQPKDSKLLSLLGKQKYRAVRRFHAPTANLTADERARAVKGGCQLAEKRGQVAAGIFSSGQNQSVLVNSRGLSASYRHTSATFSITMQQGSAASWAKANAADVREFDPLQLAKIASDKVIRAENPVELAPGRYTVILEPPAVLDLVGFLFYYFAWPTNAHAFPAASAKRSSEKTSPLPTTLTTRSNVALPSTAKACLAGG